MAAIVTEALTKTYRGSRAPVARRGQVRALHDLSIEVHEAEIFGFLGPNGSGKSTTIRLLLGYLHPSVRAAPASWAGTSRPRARTSGGTPAICRAASPSTTR